MRPNLITGFLPSRRLDRKIYVREEKNGVRKTDELVLGGGKSDIKIKIGPGGKGGSTSCYQNT